MTIDLYCERTDPGFWAEPVNALTNAAFLLAALLAWRRARRLGHATPGVALLAGLMASVGVGSFLFHTFATGWARWLDVVPILLFQLAYLGLYLRDPGGLGRGMTLAAVAGFFAAALFGREFPGVLNGSLIYAPALAVLALLAAWHARARRPGRGLLGGALVLFGVSLTLRTLDMAACDAFPLGTHFGWHLGNAGVLYLATAAWLDARRTPRRAA